MDAKIFQFFCKIFLLKSLEFLVVILLLKVTGGMEGQKWIFFIFRYVKSPVEIFQMQKTSLNNFVPELSYCVLKFEMYL